MNRCILSGRTTADAELRYAQNEDKTAIANVSLAVDDGYGETKKTSFFRLTIFGKRAEAFAKLVPKGTKIMVDARAQQQNWTAKDGSKRHEVVFLVNDWEFAQSKGTPVEQDDGWMDVSSAIEEGLPFS